MVQVGVTVSVPGGEGVRVGEWVKLGLSVRLGEAVGVGVRVGVKVGVGGLLVKTTSALVLSPGEPGMAADAVTVTNCGVSL
jgi:hypothetical protein